MNAKQVAGYAAAAYVKPGMIIGLGTGTTAFWAIEKIASMVREGLQITAVATSLETQKIATGSGITITDLDQISSIDLTIDGADEIDTNLNLIKGGGGAHVREKIIAACSKRLIIIADHTKEVTLLGKFPLPVEILPFGWQVTVKHLQHLGCNVVMRKKNPAPAELFISDNANYIADCHFGEINDPASLEISINLIPGVVENGLFVRRAERAILGFDTGETKELVRP